MDCMTHRPPITGTKERFNHNTQSCHGRFEEIAGCAIYFARGKDVVATCGAAVLLLGLGGFLGYGFGFDFCRRLDYCLCSRLGYWLCSRLG